MQKTFQLIDGIKCYALDSANQSTDYSPEHYDVMFNLESNNFWFRSRNRLIKFLFSKYLGNIYDAKVLEIGCGTGYVLQGLSEFKNLKLWGAELHLEGLKYAKTRLPNVEFVQLDMRRTPFKEEFNAVGAFDVLEHIDNDILILENINKTLKPGGLFFVTVPQHMWLWSMQDETALHKRRYSVKELLQKLKLTGFSPVFTTSFVFTLLPLMFFSRLMRKKKKPGIKYSYDELKLPFVFDKIFNLFMMLDELLIRFGIALPFGGSLAIVVRKVS